jgi:uroporphyrinogen decarboxylase
VSATTGPAADQDVRSPFLRACRGLPVAHPPVWFMRQAGRALPEYRAARAAVPMLQACRTPELVAELTLQPVRRYGVDAAILFSDIVVPLHAVGVELDIVPGVGPVVERPVTTMADVEALRPLEDADVGFISDAVTLTIRELGETPLIGFAGAPFTLASYLIEGGPSRDHLKTKTLMHGRPDVWDALLDRLADIATRFLRVQVRAGAAAVQLFDSWAGVLSVDDYRRFVLPHSTKVFRGIADLQVPRLHFGVGTGELLASMAQAGADVIGVDWRVPLDVAADRIGGCLAVQGNLDPALVLAPWEAVRAAAADVIARGKAAPGHVFNLGHGVLPSSDPGVLARLVEFVHSSG